MGTVPAQGSLAGKGSLDVYLDVLFDVALVAVLFRGFATVATVGGEAAGGVFGGALVAQTTNDDILVFLVIIVLRTLNARIDELLPSPAKPVTDPPLPLYWARILGFLLGPQQHVLHACCSSGNQ